MGNLNKDHQKEDAISKALPALANAFAEAEQWLSCRAQVKRLAKVVKSVLAQAQQVLDQAHLDYKIKSETALRQESVDLAVPAPVITLALQQRFRSRQDRPFGARLLAALRNQFGGHAVRSVSSEVEGKAE